MWFVYLLISLVLTAVFYTAPILIYRFAIRKATLNKKQAIITTVICGFVMYLLMWILAKSITDSGANATACITWSFINYYILTKEFEKNLIDKKTKSGKSEAIEQNSSNQAPPSNCIFFCEKCGARIVENSNFCNMCGLNFDYRATEVKNKSANEMDMPADPTNIEAVLKRAFIFLEDGLFDKADRYLEIVLDQDPENAKAYVGKLLINLKLQKQEQLAKCSENFEDSSDFQKALRYADEGLVEILNKYVNDAKTFREETRIEAIYSTCCQLMKSATTDDAFHKVANSFKEISGYKDVDELIEKCKENAEVCEKDSIYMKACSLSRNYDISSQKNAIALFENIIDWKDSSDKIELCKNKIERLNFEAEQKRIAEEKRQAEESIEAEKRKKLEQKLALTSTIIITCILLVSVFFAITLTNVSVVSEDIRYGYTIGSGTYFAWDKATITAVPADKHLFISWNDGNTSPEREVEVGFNYSEYVATFVKEFYEIKADPNNADYGIVVGGGTYKYKSSAIITAKPNKGHLFVKWSDGETNSTRTFSDITENVSLKAIFEPVECNIDVISRNVNFGSVSGSGTYDYGTKVTIKATPKSGYKFVSWNDGNKSANRIVDATEDEKYIATFAAISNTGYYEARIGSLYYTSLEEAIEKAASGATVTLLKDVELNTRIVVYNKNLTIEGNGYSITQTDNAAIFYFFGGDNSARTLTLKNLFLKNTWRGTTNDGYYNRCLWVGGEYANIIIYNCYLSISHADSGQAICISNQLLDGSSSNNTSNIKNVTITNSEIETNFHSFLLTDKTKVTINANCVLKSEYNVYVVDEDAGQSLISINDSELNARSYVFVINASATLVSVNNSVLNAINNSSYIGYLDSDVTGSLINISGNKTKVLSVRSDMFYEINEKNSVVITGGVFNKSNITQYIADGYTIESNGDGTWTVVKGE